MATSQNSGRQFGVRHWVYQTAPPLLLLFTLYGTDRGGSLVYVAGFFAIPALVSVVSICFKLLDIRNRKYFLLRPGLTVFFFSMILLVANMSYEVALRQATQSAEIVHERCIADRSCPSEPAGWEIDGLRPVRRDLGAVYKYTATYFHEPDTFRISLVQGSDLGHQITGGVSTPLDVRRFADD